MFSVLLTWPLVFHLSSSPFSSYGDAYAVVWGIWGSVREMRGVGGAGLLAAPFGMVAERVIRQPLLEAFLVFPALIFGEVTAYNIFILSAFTATAFSTYLFLRSMLQQELPAFFGGLIFGFCPAAVIHAVAGHLVFSLNALIPLLMWALFYNKLCRNLRSSAQVGAVYALLALASLYWGYFAIYFVVFFFAYDYSSSKSVRGLLFRNYLSCAAVAAILVLPFEYQWLLTLLPANRGALVEAGYNRALVELVTLSARPWEYVMPSIDHPVLGRLVEGWSRAHLHGSNIFEQTLYLGVIPLSSFLVGIMIAWKKMFRFEQKGLFVFFSFGALIMALLSVPPYIPIAGFKIPTLSYFAHAVAPMFRAYCRFGIWVNFFVACAAAVVLAHAYKNMRKAAYYALCVAVFSILAFEYWSISPSTVISAKTPPPIYQWLAQQPGDFVVAEYPMMPNDEAAFYTYLFWQRIHGKRLVNGASRGGKTAWAYYERVRDLSRPETVRLLKESGVRYVLVHPRMYEEGEIPGPIKRYYPPLISGRTYNGGVVPVNPLLPKPHKVFGRDVLYAL